MWIAISVLCVIVAIIIYGARKENKERDNKANDNKTKEPVTLEKDEYKVKISLKIVSILLVLLCIMLGGLYLHIRQRADDLNDALYLANGRVEQLKDKNYRLKSDLEECQRELEETKRQLQNEEQWRSDLQQHYWNLKQDYDNYANEAEGYISHLEIRNRYRY